MKNQKLRLITILVVIINVVALLVRGSKILNNLLVPQDDLVTGLYLPGRTTMGDIASFIALIALTLVLLIKYLIKKSYKSQTIYIILLVISILFAVLGTLGGHFL